MIAHPGRSIIGPIPADWDVIELRCCLLHQAAGDWGADRGDVEVSVLRSTNFTRDRRPEFSDVARRWFDPETATRFEPREGDILVERSGGGPSQPVGRVLRIDRDLPGFGYSNFVHLLRVDPEAMNPDYVAWCLFELHVSGLVERLQHQTTQMRNLDFRDYLGIRLPKPRPHEQAAISAALADGGAAIQAGMEELKEAQRLRTALLQTMFTQGMPGRHAAFEAATVYRGRFEYPRSWQLERLGQLVQCVDYGTNSLSNAHGAGYPVIAIPQVVSSRITRGAWPYADLAADEAAQLRLAAGDVLLIRTNGNPNYIGKSTVISPELAEEHLVFASYLIRIRTRPEKLLGEYLNLFLASPLGRRQAKALANTSAGNHNLGARALRQCCIPLPSPTEQEEILDVMHAAGRRFDALAAKVTARVAVKRTLRQHLLTGRVRAAEVATT